MILALISTILTLVSYGHLNISGGSNEIQTHNYCDDGAMLYLLSYKATQFGAVHVFP